MVINDALQRFRVSGINQTSAIMLMDGESLDGAIVSNVIIKRTQKEFITRESSDSCAGDVIRNWPRPVIINMPAILLLFPSLKCREKERRAKKRKCKTSCKTGFVLNSRHRIFSPRARVYSRNWRPVGTSRRFPAKTSLAFRHPALSVILETREFIMTHA